MLKTLGQVYKKSLLEVCLSEVIRALLYENMREIHYSTQWLKPSVRSHNNRNCKQRMIRVNHHWKTCPLANNLPFRMKWINVVLNLSVYLNINVFTPCRVLGNGLYLYLFFWKVYTRSVSAKLFSSLDLVSWVSCLLTRSVSWVNYLRDWSRE